MNKAILILILVSGMFSCKSKKKHDKNEKVFSAVSFLKSQVKIVDTSLYRITRIETVDSTSDTTIISRENFHDDAKDFTSIPDISSSEMIDDYIEGDDYDTSFNRILMTFSAKKPEAEVRRETIILREGDNGDTPVEMIIIDWIKNFGDSSIEKNMVWDVNKQFQVITKTQQNNKPEKVKNLVVKWE